MIDRIEIESFVYNSILNKLDTIKNCEEEVEVEYEF